MKAKTRPKAFGHMRESQAHPQIKNEVGIDKRKEKVMVQANIKGWNTQVYVKISNKYP